MKLHTIRQSPLVRSGLPRHSAEGGHLLFLSHCVPNPPDKGEKIRAHHLLRRLAQEYSIHLVCFARTTADLQAAEALEPYCASIYAEFLPFGRALARGFSSLSTGGSLNVGFYHSGRMRRYVQGIAATIRLNATVVFSVVMKPYAAAETPILLDLLDVDSEKWFQYANLRRPGPLYRLEARRLRAFETSAVMGSQFTLLTTENEEALLRSFAPAARTGYMENGADTDYFDADPRPLPPELRDRRFLVFVGTMDYYPNIDGAAWFVHHVFPELRRRDPGLEFLIVGKNPAKAILALGIQPGVRVVGGVPDVRPYLSSARAVVVPLRLARGIQNKVLEALAMGRKVVASKEVCRTFGNRLPAGIVGYSSKEEACEAVWRISREEPVPDPTIRTGVLERFDWDSNVAAVARELSLLRASTPG